MIVQLHQIGKEKSQFEFTLGVEQFTKLEKHFASSDMKCDAQFQHNMEDILLRGHFQVTLETTCDFCLAPATLAMNEEFELKLITEQALSEPQGDLEIPLHGMDTENFDGQEIDLGKIFEDQLILELPLSIKCKDNCKGLCAACGVNLNLDECKCKSDPKDHPFAVLGQLKL
ncbi:MAG: hypothetical protein COB67_09315 [SAR324 cluster bacterium]|uniref:DUF177 domain-containing protein n=1 Tax=SAR324 cluster bacterium TaxID=2024889 RepID=A0A2A4T289_9DELT|nr:MAG: hypothetical protein COB67_09315 [SAR324 cluster bacterium]